MTPITMHEPHVNDVIALSSNRSSNEMAPAQRRNSVGGVGDHAAGRLDGVSVTIIVKTVPVLPFRSAVS